MLTMPRWLSSKRQGTFQTEHREEKTRGWKRHPMTLDVSPGLAAALNPLSLQNHPQYSWKSHPPLLEDTVSNILMKMEMAFEVRLWLSVSCVSQYVLSIPGACWFSGYTSFCWEESLKVVGALGRRSPENMELAAPRWPRAVAWEHWHRVAPSLTSLMLTLDFWKSFATF